MTSYNYTEILKFNADWKWLGDAMATHRNFKLMLFTQNFVQGVVLLRRLIGIL